MAIACSAALISVVGIAVGLDLQKEQVFTAIGFVFDIMVIIIVISTIDASQLPRKSSN